jgi:two-component system CheB/CheR fusion protein
MNHPGIPIVGIGASAGGLDAFRSFFDNMPADSGMAFVVILHLPADRKSLLPEILSRWTTMRVIEADEDATIEANCVYVPPPHGLLTLAEGRLLVRMPGPDDQRGYRPIDAFFDALGTALREQAVGIVLSGTGGDGALGLKAIKECGGLTIAQGSDGSAPQYGEMPAGAIATGLVDLVVPVEDIPKQLIRMKGNRPGPSVPDDDPIRVESARLKVCAILRSQLGHDFAGYRDKTFLRRVHRRMQVVGVSTLDEYIARLQASRDEVVFLFRDLLIRVTSFFRDKETFETLESSVIPRLFAGEEADGAVRVWVPGCATGEEAYSLAILLREHMDGLRGAPKVQVFATDIDDSAIATARLGRYPATLLDGLSPERRQRFFNASSGSYVVSKEIRDLCTFSTHNLVRDPPFSRMDLVSCRNLLIYMDARLQSKAIPIFHYSLVPGGILLLGGSESAAQHDHLFEPLDKGARIFQKKDVRGPAPALPETTTRASADTASNSFLSKILGAISPNARVSAHVRQKLHSTQEELQSLTEDHQTALKELRSSNEELHSVKMRLSEKVDELDKTNSDLRNLFESTEIATMFQAPRRVLIADDNEDGAETMGMYLKMSGHEVYLAHSGTEAFELASRQQPEIAVLDIGMPGMSGYEVARRIRREHWGADIKLIAVTGWGQEDDKRLASAAGFDHHLTKPVDPDKLEQLFTLPRNA